MMNIISIMQKTSEVTNKVSDIILTPAYLLFARLYISYFFFSSGYGRLQSFLNDAWDDQIFLFSFEHPVPYIPAEFSAAITTIAELVLPILLVLGIGGRIAAMGIFTMTLVIQFTYMHSDIHFLWLALSGAIIIMGAGKWSLDNLILRKLK